MLELIQSIPGPIFLVIYFILLATWAGLSWLLLHRDDSLQYPVPGSTRLSPECIAVLRGGKNDAIQTAVFSLWSRMMLDIRTTTKQTGLIFKTDVTEYTIQSLPQRKIVLTPIEAEIYQFAITPKKASDLFTDSYLRDGIDPHIDSINRDLEALHLKRTTAHKAMTIGIIILLFFIITIFGGTKLILGISRDKPVGFLMMLISLSIMGIPLLTGLYRDISLLGKSFLITMEDEYLWLRVAIQSWKIPSGVDPAMCVAVFGMAGLEGASYFDTFTKAIKPPAPKGGGSGFGCGGCGGCGGGCGGCGGCGG